MVFDKSYAPCPEPVPFINSTTIVVALYVGASVGELVGLLVGSVGGSVGELVGLIVGCAVGKRVGESVHTFGRGVQKPFGGAGVGTLSLSTVRIAKHIAMNSIVPPIINTVTPLDSL